MTVEELVTGHHCRICDAPVSDVFCDLGMSPLCESYIARDRLDSSETYYPLAALVCSQCRLVQLREYVQPEHVFRDYVYRSAYSQVWLDHCRSYTESMINRLDLGSASLVVEAGSNDGALLGFFADRGIPVLGVDPACNLAADAAARNVPTMPIFFGVEAARTIVSERGRADLFCGNNVLAQSPDLRDFAGGIVELLSRRGTATLEFPHLLRLIEQTQFDTIYHEHYSYFSLLAIERLFADRGLAVFDVEELPTHGGSLRVYARHAEDQSRPVSPRVAALRDLEQRGGLNDSATYAAFQDRVQRLKRRLLDCLIRLKDENASIAGYSAPGKGNTLLNYCGIGTDFLDYTVDRNPHKQGLYLPGTHIPILHPRVIDETRPDYILILAWNVKSEILARLAYTRAWGAGFIVPMPTVEVS